MAARISVLAEAPGVSFIPSGRHMHDSKAPTTGTGQALYDQLWARVLAGEPAYRLVEWAEQQVRAVTHTPPMPHRSQKARVLEDYEGVDCKLVGELEGLHFTTVWRWRRAAGLDSRGLVEAA